MKVYAIINIINILLFNGAPATSVDVSVNIDPESIVEEIVAQNEIVDEDVENEDEDGTTLDEEVVDEGLSDSESAELENEIYVEEIEAQEVIEEIQPQGAPEPQSAEVAEEATSDSETEVTNEEPSNTVEQTTNEEVEVAPNENNESETTSNENQVSATQGSNSEIVSGARAPQVGDLLINEIVSDPSEGLEWVEIKNTASDNLNLAGLTVRDGGTRRLSLEGEVSGNAYRVFYFPTSTLNNSGDAVRLYVANEILLDEVIYGDWESVLPKAVAPVKGQSLIRDPDGSNSNNNSNDFKVTTFVTPGASNVLTTPIVVQTEINSTITNTAPATNQITTSNNTTQTSATQATSNANQTTVAATTSEQVQPVASFAVGALIISEVYPAPNTGEKEWIEIYNPGTTSIILDGWAITDAQGTSTLLSGAIVAGGFFVTENPRGKLNNDGDTVNLLDPSGHLTSSMTYGNDIKNGDVLAWTGSEWTKTLAPTQGEINQIRVQENDETVAIASVSDGSAQNVTGGNTRVSNTPTIYNVTPDEARELEKGTLVRTSGVVSVPPGVLGSRTFYIAGSGLQIYLHGIDVSEITTGDVLNLVGKLGSTGGETRLVVSKSENINVIGHEAEPQPEVIEIGEIGDANEGWLIQVEGMITEKTNGRFLLEDASGSISVVLKDGANIDQRVLNPGDMARIIGIVSETQSGFRLLPRGQNDLVKVSSAVAVAPVKLDFRISPLLILVGSLVSVLMTILIRRQVVEYKKGRELALVTE